MKMRTQLFLIMSCLSLGVFAQDEMPDQIMDEQMSYEDEVVGSESSSTRGLEREPGGEFAEIPRQEQEYDWQSEEVLEAEEENDYLEEESATEL